MNGKKNSREKTPKSFKTHYDENCGLIVLTVLDVEGMYPFLLRDPEVGTYKVTRTRKGGLHMTK